MQVVDSEGWVHSGDLGRMDEDGFFYVCGRMKEILITGDQGDREPGTVCRGWGERRSSPHRGGRQGRAAGGRQSGHAGEDSSVRIMMVSS